MPMGATGAVPSPFPRCAVDGFFTFVLGRSLLQEAVIGEQ